MSAVSQERLWRQCLVEPCEWQGNKRERRLQTPGRVRARLASPDGLAAHTASTSSNSNTSSSSSSSRNRGLVLSSRAGEASETVSRLCERGQLREAVDALERLLRASDSGAAADGAADAAEAASSSSSFSSSSSSFSRPPPSPPHVPVSVLYSVIKRCTAGAKHEGLALGRRVHALLQRHGRHHASYDLSTNTFLSNQVVRMYAGHGQVRDAMAAFRAVAQPDAFMWSSILWAHVRHGQAARAVQLYREMRTSRRQGVAAAADAHVLVAALQACAGARDLACGAQVHADANAAAARLAAGEDRLFVTNALVDMYAKCGRVDLARAVFDGAQARDVVTWNSIIAGYADGDGHDEGASGYAQALALYERMVVEASAAPPDAFTFACLVKAAARAGDRERADVHARVVERGMHRDLVVGNSLVDMYVKCGRVADARRVFDGMPAKDVVTWTAMIAGYGGSDAEEDVEEALRLGDAIMNDDGAAAASVQPNGVTVACLLKACARLRSEQRGRRVHAQAAARGVAAEMMVGTALVNMYAKCGCLADARRVFEGMPVKDVATWTAMIGGYSGSDAEEDVQQALELYARMEMEPDAVTLTCVAKACGSLGALQTGRRVHAQAAARGLPDADPVLANALLDMYGKCGRMEEAERVFCAMPAPDVVSWTALVHGWGQSGRGRDAVAAFGAMRRSAGVRPGAATVTCVLVACSRAGLVAEGRRLYGAVAGGEVEGVPATPEHRNTVVDMLARAGHLDEAEAMLQLEAGEDAGGMVVGLTALLSACAGHRDLPRAARCFERLVRADPRNAGAYVLMAAAYAAAGRSGDAERVERMRLAAGARKKPAVAGIEVRSRVRHFVVGGEEDNDAADKARRSVAGGEAGTGAHVPRTELVLRAGGASQAEREAALCGHAEKLALAYGLLHTPDGAPLLVTKNLRMCGDCHSATAVVSRLERREIVVRDAHRVHRFVDGACHCAGRP